MTRRARKLGKRLRVKFCAHISEHGSVTEAALLIGRSRQDLYKLRREDAIFAAEWDAARDAYLYGTIEDTVIDAAVNGYTVGEEKRDAKGEVLHKKLIKKRDVRLAMRILERRHPDYRPTQRIEETGRDGGPIQYEDLGGWDLSKLSTDELRDLRALHAKAGGEREG